MKATLRKLVLSLPLWLPAVTAAADAAYLRDLQRQADALGLADTPEWLALGHYERDWRGAGVTSTVASGWFFRAENGRRDPSAELAATLAVFFETAPMKPRGEPAQCVYRARYRFLDRHLGFVPVCRS